MAAPNLKTPTTITGKTAVYNCTGTLAAALTNSAASGKLLKINVIRASNVDGTNAIDVDVSIYRGSTHTYLASAISVPIKSTIVITSKEDYIYLEEGDSIYAKSSTSTKIDLTLSYEDIS
jgi:hypothetical protein